MAFSFRRFLIASLLSALLVSTSHGAELVLQQGHAGQMTGVALNADASYEATSALGDPIKIWRPRTGEFVRDLPDSSDELPLAWSPDGKILLCAARDTHYASPRATGGVRVRAMPSGRVIRTLRGVSAPLYFDGRIVRTSDGESVSEWRLSDGARLTRRLLQQPRTRAATLDWNGAAPRAILVEGSLQDDDAARSFAFSRDGRRLIFGGSFDTGRFCVWNSLTGKLETAIDAPKRAFGLAAVSDDGRFAVTQGEDPKWSPPGPDSPGTQAAFARTFQLHLWDLQRRRIAASWPGFYSLDGGVRFLRFSRDGQRVFCGGDERGEVRAVPSRKLIRTLKARGFHDVSRDERVWASGYVYEMKALSVATGQSLATFPSQLGGGHSVSWSPNGRFLAFGPNLSLWDVEQSRLIQQPSKEELYFNRARWKDEFTLQTENLQFASIWKISEDGASFYLKKRVEPGFPKPSSTANYSSSDYSNGVFLSPDARRLLSNWNKFNERGTLYVWNETGQILERKIVVRPADDSISNFNLLWLGDSQRFLVATQRGIEVWNAATGQKERTLDAPASWPRPTESNQDLMFITGLSPDGRFVAANGFYRDGKSGGAGIWNTETGQFVRQTASGVASWSSDNSQLALGSELWSQWQSANQARLKLPVSATYGSRTLESALAWSPNGARVAVGASDAIHVFDARDGHELGRLARGVSARNDPTGDWLAWNRDGFFNAPDGGKARVRWRENGVLLPFDSPRDRVLRAKFFQPQKVRAMLSAR